MGLLSYVNAKIGTRNERSFSHGNIYPICSVPHGMASFTIQNNIQESPWFYSPDKSGFDGIRLTHIPSPWIGDYGQLLIGVTEDCSKMTTDNIKIEPHSIDVSGCSFNLSVAPTECGGLFKFNFNNDKAEIIITGYKGETKFKEVEGAIEGFTTACDHTPTFTLKEFFYIVLSEKYEMKTIRNGIRIKSKSKEVCLYFATSFISEEQAKINYQRELADKTIEKMKEESSILWENYLNKIEIEAEEEIKRTFYSCMYRAFLFPRKFYETDKNGINHHINIKNGKIEEGYFYCDNGFWDTYRTVYPFLSLIDTKLYAEMVEGFYNVYKETGFLPRWLAPDEFACMPGTLIEAVFADAIVKDIVKKPLAEKMLEAMIDNAETDIDDERFGRKAVKKYRELGYVPNFVKESVNETLDCCYGDFCIAQVAAKIGNKELEEKYRKYAKNYAKLFDKKVGFMRSRDENGNFRNNFDSIAWGGDYTEGSAWHSSFSVMHDIEGLNKLYNGKLEEKIDELFSTPAAFHVGGYGVVIHEMSEMTALPEFGQCAICNQPSFHLPYIYSELGKTEKTAYWVKRLVKKAFSSSENGFPGDEDNGTMACWYIFSSLGFYPFCPGKTEFVMSFPLITAAKIHLDNGKILKINASDFIGKPIPSHIKYQDMMQGGSLESICNRS